MKLHLMQFDNEAGAISDPVVGALHSVSGWDESTVFLGVGVWVSQGSQPGWWAIVAKPDSDTALAQHDACRLAWDNVSAVILGGTYTGNDMSALYVSPVPAGAYNPWNGQPPAPPVFG